MCVCALFAVVFQGNAFYSRFDFSSVDMKQESDNTSV